jgi:hypothetical protein
MRTENRLRLHTDAFLALKRKQAIDMWLDADLRLKHGSFTTEAARLAKDFCLEVNTAVKNEQYRRAKLRANGINRIWPQ